MRYFLLLFILCFISSCDTLKPVKLVGWGDSMMKGSGGEFSILEVISDELDIKHKNFGVGGLKSNSIALLQGGKPMRLVFKDQEIKKSGSSEIIYYDTEPINFQTEQYREGFINEIEGKIERFSEIENPKKTLGYTFTASNLKEDLLVKDTLNFTFKNGIAYANTWTIIWAGRNDKKSGDAIYKTRDNIQAMIDHLGENAKKHVLVLSICNGIADKESIGSNAHTNITRLNTVLKESFGAHFIDIRSYMIHKAIYDMGMTPTPQDLEDIKKDCIPRSFFKDNVHFNTLGYEATGKYIAKVIKEKGWILEK
ncbi:SGNH/GDSL hydrolase family protein [uncultured Dokdonia sp.]|uniref:SGNH/GDSL hydrolase family protein n=1 Tax=uncultured Dokdonia sp. TaxID=575653 RepID=UPI002607CB3E|nr:SGNH/GDSL hydrolase family protein [uncultured Dokdonia sp.]